MGKTLPKDGELWIRKKDFQSWEEFKLSGKANGSHPRLDYFLDNYEPDYGIHIRGLEESFKKMKKEF